MPFKIVRQDITKIEADVIVNTANPLPLIGTGVDSAIYKAAGTEELLAERIKIGPIARGDIAVTPAFLLKAKYIIHAVGPVWEDGNHGEIETLKLCYLKSLEKARELSCESIAFPLISTGVYGFPKDKALQTVITVFSQWLLEHEMMITLVVFEKTAFELSGKIFHDIDAFIDEQYVRDKENAEYISGRSEIDRVNALKWRRMIKEMISGKEKKESLDTEALSQILDGTGDTFQERLFHLIDEREMTDSDVYNKANLDRKHFSKIRCNPKYQPTKKTVLSLAIALQLNMDETRDLLARAGLSLSPSDKADLIISWFIQKRIYSIHDINLALFKYCNVTLGV